MFQKIWFKFNSNVEGFIDILQGYMEHNDIASYTKMFMVDPCEINHLHKPAAYTPLFSVGLECTMITLNVII